MSGIEILTEIDIHSMNEMALIEPSLLREGNGAVSKYYGLNRFSKSFIYSTIDIKSKLSSDLFNLDEAIWKTVIDSKISDSEEDFTDNYAVVFRGNIVDIVSDESDVNDIINNFIELSKESSKSYFNSFGILNIVFEYSKSVIIASINFNSGWCSLHSGVINNGTYVIFSVPEIEANGIVLFMKSVLDSFEEISNNLDEISNNDIKSLGFNFDEFLSLREVFDIMKAICCSVSLDEDKYAADIAGMSTNNSKIIVDFINSFGSTYKSLKKLSYLRKIFRTGSITSGMMMKILTDELQSEALNIDGYTFARISNICSTEEFDKKVVEEEINTNK